MLKRKATATMESWLKESSIQALLVTGARQVGKTTAVREFAKSAGLQLAEVNFFENRDATRLVSEAIDADDLFFRLSILTGARMDSTSTLLFLDEIQECQDALTWTKFLTEKRDLKLVLSGSLLGIDAFVNARSLPVGSLKTMEMFPLDFEEFCWAADLPEETLQKAASAVVANQEVPDFLHETLMRQVRNYLLVGGMPAAVQAYVTTAQIGPVRDVQQAIHALYEADVSKYVTDQTEARQIKMVYEAIPGQLNAPSKRFKYARLGKNLRFANMETAFDWLAAAGIAIPAVRTASAEFPVGLAEDRSSFKLFMNDVGLLTSRLLGTVELDVLSDRTNINYGSMYENLVAQELLASGFTPRYFYSKSVGEIDFVAEDADRGIVGLIEVKSGKDYKRHSALSNMLNDTEANDAQRRAIVLCNGNAEFERNRSYVPIYLCGKVRKLLRA